MNTIKGNSSYQYEIKKSKFITLLYPIHKVEEVDFYLKWVKNTYKEATHYCYAYKLDTIQRFSDDGEPGGTAGIPIMELLNKKEIEHVLCIVIRYFGGIKLGAGGLVRAYSKAVREAIESSQIIELIDGYLIRIEVGYEFQKQFDYSWKEDIIKKEFGEQIIYYIEIEKEKIEELQNYNYQILETRYIEKKKP